MRAKAAGARARAAARARTAAARVAAEADHMGTTLLMTHIPSAMDNNMTIPIPNNPALHNNSSPYSRCIQ